MQCDKPVSLFNPDLLLLGFQELSDIVTLQDSHGEVGDKVAMVH